MMRLAPRLVALTALLGTLSVAGPARAQDAAAAACFPPCRAGYECRDGQCVAVTPVDQSALPPDQQPPPPAPIGIAPPMGAPAPMMAPGRPAWGPGSPTDGATFAGGPDGAAVERRVGTVRSRHRFRLEVALAAGLQNIWDVQSGDLMLIDGSVYAGGWSGSHTTVGFSTGLSVSGRYYLADPLGLYARGYGRFMPVSQPYVSNTDSSRFGQATGTALSLGGEVGVRIGPFTTSFPLFLGLGPTFGIHMVSASDGSTKIEDDITYLAGAAELGAMLLQDERLEICAQVHWGDAHSFIAAKLGWTFL